MADSNALMVFSAVMAKLLVVFSRLSLTFRNAFSTSLLTFSASKATSTRYIMFTSCCLGVCFIPAIGDFWILVSSYSFIVTGFWFWGGQDLSDPGGVHG